MFNSLRARITLTNLIPTILITPLLALFLISSLVDFYGRRLADDLQAQGSLLVDQLLHQPELVQNPAALQAWLQRVNDLTSARVLIVSEQGTILAATELEDRPRIGQRSADEGVALALGGQVASGSRFSQFASSDVAFVALPIPAEARPLGAIRLSLRLADIEARLFEMRLLVIVGTFASLLVAMLMALALASTLARPLRQLNQMSRAALNRDYQQRAKATGIREVDELVSSFNQLSETLAQQIEVRQQLLADITHELGTPLGALHAASEALLAGALRQAELARQLIVGMQAEIARLGRLAQSLNDLSLDQIMAGQLHRTPTNLLALTQQAALRFQPEMEQASIALACCLPDQLPEVMADGDRITQVLNNLLANAKKFTPAHGTVTLSAGADAQWVWVAVSDDGLGVEPADQARIFERFYRTSYAQPIQQGMGLGLAIAHEIMQAHNGLIEVQSARGMGSTFMIRLPRT